MDQNNPWLKLTTAPIFERGNFFKPGNYKLKEQKSITKKTRKGASAWIVEFEVLESDNPAHAVGSRGAWYQDIDSDSGPSAINAWLMAMFGFSDPNAFMAQYAQHIPAIMNAAEAQGYWHTQPGVGTIGLATSKKWTKSNRIFTVHDWNAWTPPAGWQPKPTPATAAVPQEDPPREGQMALPNMYPGYGNPGQPMPMMPGPQTYGHIPQPTPPGYPIQPQVSPGYPPPSGYNTQMPGGGAPQLAPQAAPGVPGGWPPPRQ